MQHPEFLLLIFVTMAAVSRIQFRNRMTSAMLMSVLIGCAALVLRDFRFEFQNGWKQVHASFTGMGDEFSSHWPPRIGERFPDLILYDQEGRLTPLSSLAGKVLLIEPIGMPCRACVAFSGGHEHGPFDGVSPQANLDSIETLVRQYGSVSLDDPRLVYVQLLLFDRAMRAPTPDDARRWARHFRLERSDRKYVFAGDPALVTAETRNLIPGFYLVDSDFIVRADSTGSQPRHDLYQQLIPSIPALLKEVRSPALRQASVP